MTVEKLIAAFEKYYLDTYPAIVRAAIVQRYQSWTPDGIDQLFDLAIQKVSRSFKVAPDLAQLIPLEEEALDQRDIVRLQHKPSPGQKLISGRTFQEDREAVAAMFAGLGLKYKPMKTVRGKV